MGLCLLLLTGVLEWQDLIEEKGAWDALVWFGGFIMLAGQFEKAGFPSAFAHASARVVGGLPWLWALVGLIVIYVYAHYAFASLVAHVTAMFPAFFAVAIGLGAPPLLAALAFGVFSSLNAATTHYGTGPAPIVFGAGYAEPGRVVANGVCHLARASGDLAAGGVSLVEGAAHMVKRLEQR